MRYFIEKCVAKFNANTKETPIKQVGHCKMHDSDIQIRKFVKFCARNRAKIMVLKIIALSMVDFFSLGCLEHVNDMCLKCAIEKICGDELQSKQCNMVAMSELNERAEDETAKIKGTACIIQR